MPTYIMSEKELDEILNEIKRNGRGRDTATDDTDINQVLSQFSGADDKPAENTTAGDSNLVFNEVTRDSFIAEGSPKQEDVAIDLDAFVTKREQPHDSKKKNDDNKSGSKKVIIVIVAVIVAVAIGVGVYFGFFAGKKDETPKDNNTNAVQQQDGSPAVVGAINPLTGESGYDQSALTQRPIAVVVENEYSTESVRPQWGLADADIVLEGESEFSTRLLLFWADYNKVPEQVGPARSARPPFINFSQLFDAVFIHAGMSHSRGNYVGASEVFKTKGIDHINLLSLSEDGGYFGRDKTRTTTVEHTGYLNGTRVPELLESKNIDTTLNESKFTTLKFNQEAKPLSGNVANTVSYKWSSNCPKKATFTYDSAAGIYTTTDFDSTFGFANVKWQNLIFLNDQTEYVVKENYKGQGGSETYCDYHLSGGEGMVLSQGTYVNIKWGVTDGKLWLHDAATGEDIVLNPGKSYIGYGSGNHGGQITVE
ncbi:MAG: DUF3048 domain-containing protein [Eubacterium sp.]